MSDMVSVFNLPNVRAFSIAHSLTTLHMSRAFTSRAFQSNIIARRLSCAHLQFRIGSLKAAGLLQGQSFRAPSQEYN